MSFVALADSAVAGLSPDGGQLLDQIVGTDANDDLMGTEDADTIKGLGGDDLLQGLDGDDLLVGGAGDDTLQAGAGSDTLRGGEGHDLAILDHGSASQGLSIDLGDWRSGRTITVADGAGDNDVLQGIEQIELVGSQFGDTLSGSREADIIYTHGDDLAQGSAGDDLIFDGGGNSTLSGGAGADRISISDEGNILGFLAGQDVVDGGVGIDTLLVDWSHQVDNITAILKHNELHTGNFDDAVKIDALHIEQMSFSSGSGDDVLVGGRSDDTLFGGYGDDNLAGGRGADVLWGGYGAEDDTLNGGAGVDLYLWNAPNLIDPNLMDASDFHYSAKPVVIDDPQGGHDTVSNIEGVELVGSVADDTMIGSDGTDLLIGSYGSDLMSGGADDDLFEEAPRDPFGGLFVQGDDTIDGGGGFDTVSYASDGQTPSGAFSQDLIVDLGAGTAYSEVTGHDTLTHIEHVIAGAGDDTLIGSSHVDNLEGGGGDDVIYCGSGDRISGGEGADLFIFKPLRDFENSIAYIRDISGEDVIDLSRIDADITQDGNQAFHLASAFDGHAGELVLHFDPIAGATMLLADVDGDGQADTDGEFICYMTGHHTDFANFVL